MYYGIFNPPVPSMIFYKLICCSLVSIPQPTKRSTCSSLTRSRDTRSEFTRDLKVSAAFCEACTAHSDVDSLVCVIFKMLFWICYTGFSLQSNTPPAASYGLSFESSTFWAMFLDLCVYEMFTVCLVGLPWWNKSNHQQSTTCCPMAFAFLSFVLTYQSKGRVDRVE